MKKTFEIESSEKKEILEMYSKNSSNLLNEQVGIAVAFLVAGLAFGFGTKAIQSQFLLNKVNNSIEHTMESIETLNKKLRENNSYYGTGTETQAKELIKLFTENYAALKKLKDGIAPAIDKESSGLSNTTSDEFLKQSITRLEKDDLLKAQNISRNNPKSTTTSTQTDTQRKSQKYTDDKTD